MAGKSTGYGERGANLVEMALVMTLLVMLIAGAFDLGRAFHRKIVITNASRVGARYGSHYPWDEERIKEATRTEAAGDGVDLSAAGSVTVDGAHPGAGSGDTIRVDVSYMYESYLLGGMPNLAGLGTLLLHASTEMIVYGLDEPTVP